MPNQVFGPRDGIKQKSTTQFLCEQTFKKCESDWTVVLLMFFFFPVVSIWLHTAC